jgi:signal transduction histidine kinase
VHDKPPSYREVMRRSALIDGGAAALAIAFLLAATPHIEVARDERSLDALGYAVLVVAGGSLAISRRRPWIAVGVIAAALTTYIVREYAGGPVFVTGWISLFSLGYHVRRRNAFFGAAVMSGALIIAGLITGRSEPLIHLAFVGWSAAAVVLGDLLHTHRDSRVEEARRHLAEERLRIAQDLHDSVAHAMATINVQAGAAAHVVDRRPEAAKEALTAIQEASGDVLDELGALLNVLREPDTAAARTPTPGLRELPALVEATTKAGLVIHLNVDGPIDAVAQPAGTAAYRIVQESLTNVVRHAGGTHANVNVHVDHDGALEVDITDDGRGGSSSHHGAGRGIQGMRERAATTGGAIDIGPRAGGGFAVHATWPGRR